MTFAETAFSSLFLALSLACTAAFSFTAIRSVGETNEICRKASLLMDTDRKVRETIFSANTSYLESRERTLKRVEEAVKRAVFAEGVSIKEIKGADTQNGFKTVVNWQYEGETYVTKAVL